LDRKTNITETSLVQQIKTKRITLTILLLILGLYCYKTISYVPVWKNNMTIFNYIAKKIPENARIRTYLGGEYYELAQEVSDDPERQKGLVQLAIAELEAGLAIYEYSSFGYNELGNCYNMLQDYDKAEINLKKALQIYPKDKFVKSSLGVTYYMTHRYKEAAEIWESIEPALRNQNDLFNMYLVYRKLGQPEKANHYRKLSGK
jgi:tetratricopeptide (TPR) repeat protein